MSKNPPLATMSPTADRISKNFIGAVEDEWQLYSDRLTDYTRGAPIGFGASSTVYSAHYQPGYGKPIPCALKVLDLDSLPPQSLSRLHRETQLMSLSKHPNVLRVRGTWIDGHKLYIAMRLMNKGSAADVMRYGWPGGMEEEVVRCILKQALEGLNYLHMNGLIHRDIKAANMLIDDDGNVLLGDLGVAASLVEDHDQPKVTSPNRRINFDVVTTAHPVRPLTATHPRPKMGKRKSFVGTPCWMAPELIQGKQYDSSADIWSFGITALELTQGRPPRSRESPHAVLLQTVQGAPPTLDRVGGDYKYSRAFKEVVEWCLVKDPSKRPTAEQLLQSSFFKAAKKKSYLVTAILNGLPPLTRRQERLARPASINTHGTIESWDFSLSPTTSLGMRSTYLHRASLASKSIASLDAGGMFDFEAEDDVDADVDPQLTSNIDVVKNVEEPQMGVYAAQPLSPPETASSLNSSPPSSPQHEELPTITGASAPDATVTTRPAAKHFSSRPVPVPIRTDPHTNSYLPNSDPTTLPILGPSPSNVLSPKPQPSTSAPLASAFPSGGLWRKLTGIPNEVATKDAPATKSRKGFLSRKASLAGDALVRTKSRTVGLLQGST